MKLYSLWACWVDSSNVKQLFELDRQLFPELEPATKWINSPWGVAVRMVEHPTKQRKPIAFVAWSCRKHHMEILRLGVLPEERGYGIARALLDDLVSFLPISHGNFIHNRPQRSLAINVSASNLQGQQWLRRQGFIATPFNEDVYRFAWPYRKEPPR